MKCAYLLLVLAASDERIEFFRRIEDGAKSQIDNLGVGATFVVLTHVLISKRLLGFNFIGSQAGIRKIYSYNP